MAKQSIPRACEQCGSEFLTVASAIKKGYGRFCGNRCARLNQWAGHATTVQRQCEGCGVTFTAQSKFVRQGGARFCCMSCAQAGRQQGPPEARFWANVQKTEGCWTWTASRDGDGYGRFKAPGHRAAHPFSYELHFGKIPDGLCVLHRCDNPPCVRPDHLFLGTKKDNAIDMLMKGRGKSPLTAALVRTIRDRYAAGGITMTALGVEFGIHKSTVRDVVNRKRWTHVE